MLGELVAVLHRHKVGEDSMGEPVYEWNKVSVDNVLVRPLTGSELSDALRPDGVRVRYVLAFPKSYVGDLSHARVALVERGMDEGDPEAALRVTGNADKTPQSPIAWDRSVEVGRVDG